MRTIFLCILFLVALAISLLVLMPIGTVLKITGAQARGLSWEQASGTLRDGQLTGVQLHEEVIGSARLKLDPSSILAGGIRYAASWDGPSGKGSGTIGVFTGDRVVFNDLRLELNVTALKGMANWVRQTGGTIRIRSEEIVFRSGACEAASGTAWSDALVRGGALLGTPLPELNGDLICRDGWLMIPLGAEAQNGMTVALLGRVNLVSPGNFEARVSGSIPADVRIGLPLAGFMPVGNDFVYTYSPSTEQPS